MSPQKLDSIKVCKSTVYFLFSTKLTLVLVAAYSQLMSECPFKPTSHHSLSIFFVWETRPKVPSPDKASRRYLVFGGWEVKGV